MANANISIVTLTNTFDDWRIRTNDVIYDRNNLRNSSYTKDQSDFIVANGSITISRDSRGTTLINDNDALIGGSLTSNSVLILFDARIAGNTTLSNTSGYLFANNNVATRNLESNVQIYAANISANGFVTVQGLKRDSQNNILNVNSSLYMSNSGNIILNNEFLATGLITANSNTGGTGLYVRSNAVIGNATISMNTNSGNLAVTKNTSTGNLAVTQNTTTGNLIVLQNTATGNLAVTQNVASGNVAVSQNTVTGNLAVLQNTSTGNLSVSTNTVIGLDLVVTRNTSTGNATVSQNVSTGNLSATLNIATGNIAVTRNTSTGNLAVTQNTTTGNIAVSQNTTTGNIAVSQNTSTGNIAVSQNTSTGNLAVSTNAAVSGALTVGTNAVISNNVSTANLAVSTNISTGNIAVTTNLHSSGTLFVASYGGISHFYTGNSTITLRSSQGTDDDGQVQIFRGSNAGTFARNNHAGIKFTAASNVWQVAANTVASDATGYRTVLTTSNVSDSVATSSSINAASLTAVKTAYDLAFLAANTVTLSQNSGAALISRQLNFVNTATMNVSVTSSTSNIANIEFAVNTSSSLVQSAAVYNLPNSGTTEPWIKLGTWFAPQQGYSMMIEVIGKNGYNADIVQGQYTQLIFKTSNGTSSINGFYGVGSSFFNTGLSGGRTTPTAPSMFKVVQITSSQYDFYGKFGQYTGIASIYNIKIPSNTNWVNSSTVSDEPLTGSFISITPTALIGPQGSTGSQGTQGTQGQQGTQGTQGSSIQGYAGTQGATGISLTSSSNNYLLKNVNNIALPSFVYENNGRIGIGTQSPTANLHVNGSFAATTKSFLINHPTRPGMLLRYGSLEGPENGVYVRGRIQGNTIELPDYWTKLIDPNSITVTLTPIGSHQKLYVQEIGNNKVTIANDGMFAADIDCYYIVNAERIDIEKLKVEE